VPLVTCERLFVMHHMMNTMNADVSTKDDVWYMDLGGVPLIT